MAYGKRTWRWQASAAVFSVALAACGGGGGDTTNTDSNNDDDVTSGANDSPASVTTVSGTVQKPAGTTIGGRGWDDRILAALGSFVSPLGAAVTGLEDAPAGTPVRIIRVDSDGKEVEELGTGQTDGDGSFTVEAGSAFEATGDIVVVAGTSDPIRAPAGGRDVSVSPVSESIVRKVLDRVKNGGSSFDRFSATELAALVELVVDELESSGTTTDFTGKSVSDAAADVDNDAGDIDDQLVADSEGDSGIAFGGAKNLAGIGLELVREGDREGRVGIDAEIFQASVAEGPVLDFSGQTIEVFETDLAWSFTDGSTDPTFTVVNDRIDDSIPADEEAFPAAVGNNGRLTVNAETPRRGGVSADGERFAFVGTAGGANDNYAQLVVGAAQWNPGDVSETYNVLKFTPVVDDSAAGSNFLPGTLAMYTAQRTEMAVDCTGGSCDVESSATSETSAYYAQSGPKGFRDGTGNVGTGENPVDFTQPMTLTDDGTMTGTWSDGVARALLAPGAEMFLLHYQIAGDNGFPGQSFYYGLPKGESCDAGTFSGTYNMAGLGLSQFDGDDGTQVFDGAIETETLGFAAEVGVDGPGTIKLPNLSTVDTELTFLDGMAVVSRAGDSEAGADLTYTMNADCTFTIAGPGGGTSAGGDLSRVSTTGFVSPDGETVVIGDHSQSFDGTGADDVFTQVLIGFRAPSD